MEKKSSKGLFLVLGFIPDTDPKVITGRPETGYGVHTPLRSDGYYGNMPTELAKHWRQHLLHPEERIVVVQIVDDGDGVESD